MTQRVYVVFEGGGAKGIVHLGALRALEEHARAAEARVAVRGYAGTSAGAIVAALAAAGWRSDELFDRRAGTDLLTTLARARGGQAAPRGPTDLLGPDWPKLSALRRLGGLAGGLDAAVALVRPFGLVLLAWFAAITLSIYAFAPMEVAFWWATALLVLVVALVVTGLRAIRGLGVRVSLREGIAKLDPLVAELRDALKLKVHGRLSAADAPVTFRDLPHRLKVVACDITDGTVRLFPSREADFDLDVAEAVAASAAIPFVFGARRIDGHWHVDGGMLSNLPAWAYDHELRLDEEASVTAFEISERSAQGSDVARLVRTAIFGSKPIALRNVPQLHVATLPCEIGVLDFDASGEDLARQVENAYRVARDEVLAPLLVHAEVLTEIAEIAKKLFRGQVDRQRRARGIEAPYAGEIRASIATPFGIEFNRDHGAPEPAGLRHRFSCSGYDTAPDLRVSLPVINSVCGHALAGANSRGLAIYRSGDQSPEAERVSLGDDDFRVARNRTSAVPAFVIAAARLRMPDAVARHTGEACVLQIDYTEALELSEAQGLEIVERVRDLLQGHMSGKFA